MGEKPCKEGRKGPSKAHNSKKADAGKPNLSDKILLENLVNISEEKAIHRILQDENPIKVMLEFASKEGLRMVSELLESWRFNKELEEALKTPEGVEKAIRCSMAIFMLTASAHILGSNDP